MNFPNHIEMSLTHNEFARCYSNAQKHIEDLYDYYEDDHWISKEEKENAIKTNSIWTLHWYPDTPVGFCVVHASTLEALLEHIK